MSNSVLHLPHFQLTEFVVDHNGLGVKFRRQDIELACSLLTIVSQTLVETVLQDIGLFWLWGGRGFGNGFGNGGDCCANGLPAQLNNDYGRELLMQAIQGNRSAIDQIASALNCSTTQLQNAIQSS